MLLWPLLPPPLPPRLRVLHRKPACLLSPIHTSPGGRRPPATAAAGAGGGGGGGGGGSRAEEAEGESAGGAGGSDSEDEFFDACEEGSGSSAPAPGAAAATASTSAPVPAAGQDALARAPPADAAAASAAASAAAMADPSREGASRVLPGMFLLHAGEPMCEPLLQPPAPVTEDMIEERQRVLLSLGSSREASRIRQQLQADTLLTDMQVTLTLTLTLTLP